MKQPNHIRIFIGAMLVALLFVFLICALLYGWYIHTQDGNLPFFITHILLPLLVAAGLSQPLITYLYRKKQLNVLIIPDRQDTAQRLFLALLLIIPAIALFQPLATSIRYNVGKVMHLQSIEDMPPHVQPIFLSLGEWHVDRMRVAPIHTYEKGKLWNSQKVYLKSLFLLPIFSKSNAYECSAKAWLAFKYEHTISKKDFFKDKGQSHFEQSVRHFRKINVGGFLYFESYPPGKEKELLTLLARNHSYFKSSYSAIYQGNGIDRDLISLRYFFYTVLGFIVILLPLYWLIARFLLAIPANSEEGN